jgi:hypothetical protein
MLHNMSFYYTAYFSFYETYENYIPPLLLNNLPFFANTLTFSSAIKPYHSPLSQS